MSWALPGVLWRISRWQTPLSPPWPSTMVSRSRASPGCQITASSCPNIRTKQQHESWKSLSILDLPETRPSFEWDTSPLSPFPSSGSFWGPFGKASTAGRSCLPQDWLCPVFLQDKFKVGLVLCGLCPSMWMGPGSTEMVLWCMPPTVVLNILLPPFYSSTVFLMSAQFVIHRNVRLYSAGLQMQVRPSCNHAVDCSRIYFHSFLEKYKGFLPPLKGVVSRSHWVPSSSMVETFPLCCYTESQNHLQLLKDDFLSYHALH